MNSQPNDRHLTRSRLQQYLDSLAPAIVRLEGDPAGHLVIDPQHSTLSLRFPRDAGTLPDLAQYKHFTAGLIAWNGANWYELGLAVDTDLMEAYPVLCAAADRIQLDGLSFRQGVLDALDAYRELLAGQSRLSEEAEVGLFGELLVLLRLIRQFGGTSALASWRGPAREEHDFGIDETDVEVKTTTGEARRHWINDLAQLNPSPNRALWLLSVQLTVGGGDGKTLPELIGLVRSTLTEDGSAAFSASLLKAGWNEAAAGNYRSTFRLRTKPAAFAVNAGFPALTPATLQVANLDPVRFPKVRYIVDLTGLPTSPAPFGLDQIDAGARNDQ